MRFEEKVIEYIKSIENELLDDPNLVFSDGTSQHLFYEKLVKEHDKLSKKINPTKEEQIKLLYFHQIKSAKQRMKNKKTEENNTHNKIGNFIDKEEAKVQEIIEDIKRLKELPSYIDENGKCYNFSDGTNKYNYYKKLESFYKENKDKKDLTSRDKIKIDNYKRIKEVLDEYKIIPLKRKIEDLKITIITIGNSNSIPKKRKTFFEGFEEQEKVYQELKKEYRRVKIKKDLTEPEELVLNEFYNIEKSKRKVESYSEIKKEEKRTKELKEKIEEFKKTIIALKQLPTFSKKGKVNKNEYLFKDGTNQRFFYEDLKRRSMRLAGKKNLTPREQLIEDSLIEIEELLNSFKEEKKAIKEELMKEFEKQKIEKENIPITEFKERTHRRTIELIRTIEKIKRIPTMKEVNKYLFTDGTSQRYFYNKLVSAKNKANSGKELNWREEIEKECYNKVKSVIEKYKPKETSYTIAKEKTRTHVLMLEYKTWELIRTIKKIGGLPPYVRGDKNQLYLFEDGTSQRNFYKRLLIDYYNFTNLPSEKITKLKTKYIECFERVREALKECENGNINKEICVNDNSVYDERFKLYTTKFIQTILELERLPRYNEYHFAFGQDYRVFYERIKDVYEKVNSDNSIRNEYLVLINNYENIEWYIGFIHLKKYYDTYNDLNIIKGYKSVIEDSIIDLRSWLDKQKELCGKLDKTSKDLQREEMLDALYPAWYIDIEEVEKKKKKNI